MNTDRTDPFARGLADRLAGEAARLDLGTPMVDVVVRRGRQRQQRKRTVTSVLVVSGVCAAAIVSINVLTRPTEQHVVTGDAPNSGTVPSDAAGAAVAPIPAQLIDSNLTWSRFDPDSAAAISFLNGSQQLTGPGPYLAWSTAPGKDDLRSMLWRSDDGLSWQQAAQEPTEAMSELVARNGRFIAYGTAPGTNGSPSESVIATSDDAGDTWSTQSLPIDVSQYEGQRGIASVTVSSIDVAAGPQGVMLLARVTAQLDTSVLPEGARDGSTITFEGIETNPGGYCRGDTVPLTAPECAATTTIVSGAGVPSSIGEATTPVAGAVRYSWADLGISPEAGRLLAGTERHVLFSADGSEFVEVGDPTGGAEQFWDARVIEAGGSFVVSLTESNAAGTTSRLFRTADGSSWTDLGSSPLAWAESLGTIGERFAVVGYLQDANNPQGPAHSAVAVRETDGTWRTVSMDGLALPTDGVRTSMSLIGSGVAVGSNGITALAYLNVDPVAEMGGLQIEHGGITLRAEDNTGTYTFTDADGRELGKIVSWASTSPLIEIDPQRGDYLVRLEDGGDVVATFTQNDVYEQIPATSEFPKAYVLHSTDGVSWSRELLSDLVGAQVGGTGGIRVTDTQIIVAANLAGQKNPDGTPTQTLLVGTPNS